MVLVSGPYSSTDDKIKQQRLELISKACVNLMFKGLNPISPLAFGVSLIEKSGMDLPDNYEYWDNFCSEFVSLCDTMYILNIDGWEKSNGVKSEIEVAVKNNIPVYLVDVDTLEHIKIVA